MAKAYTISEMWEVIDGYKAGARDEDTMSFMSKYPAVTATILQNDLKSVLAVIPWGSPRLLEKALIEGKTEKPDDEPEEKMTPPEPKLKTVNDSEDKPETKRRGRPRKVVEPEPDDADDDATETPEDEPESTEDDTGEDWPEDEEKSEYDGLTSRKLYDMCIKAGIKAKPQMEVDYYIEKLEYLKKKNATEEKPTKKENKPIPKAKEPKDEDDDWDF